MDRILADAEAAGVPLDGAGGLLNQMEGGAGARGPTGTAAAAAAPATALRQCTMVKPIARRPAAAGDRRQAGHWEGDLIIGAAQRSAIATLVERKTRYAVLVPLPGGHAAGPVADALISAFTLLPAGLRRTLTWDQGNEMFKHTRIYFADPHSPWQRGTNENTNGLLRQYLPKSTDLRNCPRPELDRIAAELNDRPRLCLNDRTPAQLMRRRHLPGTARIRDDP